MSPTRSRRVCREASSRSPADSNSELSSSRCSRSFCLGIGLTASRLAPPSAVLKPAGTHHPFPIGPHRNAPSPRGRDDLVVVEAADLRIRHTEYTL